MKNEKIEILRGVAIIAVLAIHTVWGGYIGIIIRPFINFAVGMFIFISGYLTNCSEKYHYDQMYKKRILRVLVPYIIWSIIYTIAYIFNGEHKNILFNFLTGQSCNIYYYILVYIQLTLISPIAEKLMKSKYKKIGFFITPSVLLAYYLYIFVVKKEIPFPWNANNFLVWFIYFYLGLILGNKKIKIILKKSILKSLTFFALILQILEANLWYKLGYNAMATSQLKLSSMLLNIFILLNIFYWLENKNTESIKFKKLKNILISIGDMSFGIYLSHILILGILNIFFSYWKNIIFPLNTFLLLTINIMCIIAGRKILNKKTAKYIGLF